MNENNTDYIYFNIDSTFEGETTFNFDENRVQPILKHPNQWELSVERFEVPSLAIPIRFNKTNEFKISLEFNGTRIDEFVTFPIPAAGGYKPTYPPYYGIWHYNELTQGINATLASLHNQMKVAQPTFTPTKPVYMDYESKTSLFPLYWQTGYAYPTTKLIFNSTLFYLFCSYQVFDQPTGVVPNQIEFIIKLKDNGNNSTTLGGYNFKTQQNYTTIGALSEATAIVFETNSIPIVPEFLGTDSATNVTRQTITDFLLPRDAVQDRSAIQYVPQSTHRWTTLTSNEELRRIDIKVSWIDTFGNLYPLISDNNNPISIKLVFRRRIENTLSELNLDKD